jgi:hypothetical protein
VQGAYPMLMRKRVDKDSCDEIVIDQNEIAKNHSYVGVMNERVSRDSDQARVAFAVDTDGHQRWEVMPCCRPAAFIRTLHNFECKLQVWVRDLEKKTITQRIPGAFCLEWYRIYAHQTALLRRPHASQVF